MSWKIWAAALAAAVLCTTAAAATPLEAYGRLPTLGDFRISPDGSSIAYAVTTAAKRVVIIRSLKDNKVVGGVNVGDAKLRELRWADSHTLLITTSATAMGRGVIGARREYSMLQSFDVDTKAQHALLNQLNDGPGFQIMNVAAGRPVPRVVDGHTYVFVPGVFFVNTGGRLGLIRIDLTTGQTRLVSNPKDTDVAGWEVDEAGNIVAEAHYREHEQQWRMDVFHNGERIHVMDVAAPIESPHIEGLNEDGTAVVVATPHKDSKPTYEQVSLQDGKISPWQHADVGFGDIMTGRTARVIGGTRESSINDYAFFDPHADVVWRSTKTAFKGATNVAMVSWTDDLGKVVVHVLGEFYGDRYFLVDMATHHASPLGSEYEGVDETLPVKWIEYSAGDGRKIHAYLTTPAGREKKNLPLIVLPHGGPAARDEPGFDWISQALASRGYAVLQPQFRGSEGFGQDLLTAGYGEFGKKMQTDLSDGVRALAAQGLIDAKRVCIVGASYGGYAALAGATLDTGVYRCAVSISGPSDLRAFLGNEHYDERAQRYWDRFMGITDRSDPKLDAISPIKHIDKVTIPILLIHGKDDTVVPFAQSDDMAGALKAAGKPYEFVVLAGEDHWLSKSETRLQMLEATVKFLETNNPPDPATVASSARP